MGRQSDDGSASSQFRFLFSNGSRRLQSAHSGHLEIHQNEIEPFSLDSRYGVIAIGDYSDVMSLFLQ